MDTSKLSERATALLAAAQKAQQNAYAPYSNFKVGAALYDEQDNVHAGCNVENAAYPLGQCAEASAIGAMVASGAKSIQSILITSPNNDFCFPCGGCRQKIAEFANAETPIVLVTQEGNSHTTTVGDMLPNAFNLD